MKNQHGEFMNTKQKQASQVELHGIRVLDNYPCGCKFWVEQNGDYKHFVSQECKFDRKKIGLEIPKGYFYLDTYDEH